MLAYLSQSSRCKWISFFCFSFFFLIIFLKTTQIGINKLNFLSRFCFDQSNFERGVQNVLWKRNELFSLFIYFYLTAQLRIFIFYIFFLYVLIRNWIKHTYLYEVRSGGPPVAFSPTFNNLCARFQQFCVCQGGV